MGTPPEVAERRQLVWAGIAFFGALLVLIIVAVLFAGDLGDERTDGTTIPCATDDAVCHAEQQAGERPGIIPQPGEGQAPEDAGDPGGWGQIAVFVGIVVALTVIGVLVARSIRRARSLSP